jgi:hypothetical protein
MELPFKLGQGRSGSKGKLTDEEIALLHGQRLRQALDDSSLLVAFAAESKSATKPEVLTSLIKATLLYKQGQAMAEAAEYEFWNAYSALTTAVQPATVAGIRNGTINKDLGFLGWMLKYPWISLPATVALVLYIVLQIYTVRGAHILKQYDLANTELTETRRSMLQGASAEQSDSFQAISERKFVLEGNVDRYKGLLAEWNRCTFYTLYLFCPPDIPVVAPASIPISVGAEASGSLDLSSISPGAGSESSAPSMVAEDAVRAQIRLNNLNASILPMILGLLGACTQVLRSISRRVIDQSMNTIFLPAYYVRIVLGMIVGATIGLFLLPSSSPTTTENPFSFLTNLPLLTAAFLAGYAAEVFFALLDRVVGDARNYVAGSKPADK